MKALKKVLIILIVLVVVILIVSAFLPSQSKVERSLLIKASSEVISAKITNLHNWDEWSPWKDRDSAAKYIYNDTIGIGGWMDWTGNVAGSGKLSITKVKPDSIQYFLSFREPFKSESNGSFSFVKTDSGTIVTWTDVEVLPWPMVRIVALFMNFDKMMGPDFEKGLEKLKKTSEKKNQYTYNVQEREITEMTIATIRNKVNVGEIGNILGKSYGEIQAFIAKNGAKIAGAPIAITLAWDSLSWDFEAALPIDKEIKGNDRIQIKKSFAGKVLFVEYKGAYNKTYQAYIDLENYKKEKGYVDAGGPWEVYITDPMTEPDTSKWITEIYFPVK
jgi:effector-binding domain-containing protein